ncbi:LAETG motif-containing sortase-dependent surface protein [Streptomyces sp. NPDC014861]|uniref:LAETG motif-containing sortase-dependent surface protein n=1 Tax=Streptomyces sp. NPDC014861 TaxID=3364923 RepID=UPI0036FA76CC
MKIRRILATAVAAAVTTPVVFLSAGTAVADTPKPSQKQTAGTADHEDDEVPTIAELEEAVKTAQAKVDDLKDKRAKLLKDIDEKKVDAAVQAEYDAAKQAYDDAKAAGATAVQAVTAAEAELKKVTEDPASTEQQKSDATKAVEDAVKKRDEATAAEKTAKERFDAADEALIDAHVALTQEYTRLGKQLESAEEELAQAKEDLEFWESIGEGCKEDSSLSFSLTGPDKIAAGGSGVFTLSLTNVSDRPLDDVQAWPGVAIFGTPDEDELDPEHPPALERATVEWSSEDVLEWTPLTDEFDTAEFGGIDKGHTSEVKLRVTVDGDAPLNQGVLHASAMYENDDRSCGISDKTVEAWFDVTGTDKGEPTPSEKPTAETESPSPEPSPSTSTPTPAATSGTTGTTGNNTTAQGGSSNTSVNGELAETGSSDAMPKLAAAAGAALALGVGALFLARRRKAGA